MNKPNKMLEIDVQDTLAWDPTLDDRRISVNADNGHVTLSGSVPTYYDRVRATDDAYTVGGVKSLDNELLVGAAGELFNDANVADACRDALDRDRFVPQGSVTPTVTNGNVQLRGHVRNPMQRKAAEHAVSRVDGVVSIENLIAISPEPIPTDVADRISKAFERNAVVHGSRIRVSNDGHTIFLTGSVSSYAAMRDAGDIAATAPGVDRVVNDLIIEP